MRRSIFFSSFLLLYLIHCLSIDWTIHVYTGSERSAGTDSNIYVSLFSLKYGYTPEYELSHENWIFGSKLFPYKDLFENGEHDRFRISIKQFDKIDNIYVRFSISFNRC